MSIYVITNSEIHDPAAYEKYKAAAPQYVARHGGEYCVRGGAFEVLVGDWQPTRLLVLKFPSRKAYADFMADPDYQPWKELRESISTPINVVIVDGYDS